MYQWFPGACRNVLQLHSGFVTTTKKGCEVGKHYKTNEPSIEFDQIKVETNSEVYPGEGENE